MTAAVSSTSRRQRHPFRRAVAAVAVAAAIVPTTVLTTAGPSAAATDPTFTVAPRVDLDPAGDTVTVTGRNYPDGAGIYVRFCSAPAGALGTAAGRLGPDDCEGPSSWFSGDASPGSTPMVDGSWSVDLDVVASIGSVDCTVADSCGVYVRRDHRAATDYSYDAFTPIAFAAPEAPAPTFTVAPRVDLDPAGDTVTVTGRNYPDGAGIYVRFCSAPAGALGTAAGRLGPDDCEGPSSWFSGDASPGSTPMVDGSWSVDLDVVASIGSVDCTVADSCGVYVRRDHRAATDYSYDAFTPISFATPPGAGPTYTVAPTTGLDAAGDLVEVDGSGYPADQGFYVRFCAAPSGTVGTAAARPGADDCDGQGIWVTNQYTVLGTTPNDDGSWNLELDVVGAFATASRTVDCTAPGSCGIFVRRDTAGATDYRLDSFTPLTFDPATTPPVIDEPTAPSLNTVELSLSKDEALADGETITAEGAKYQADDGIYVQFCAAPTGQLGTAAGRALQCYPGQDGIHTVWFTPIPADGTFSTPVRVEKSFSLEDGTVIDCSTDDACGIFTRRDHNGGSDYSQDAFVGVSFGDAIAPEPEASTLSADRTSDLNPDGDVIEVEGADFRPGVDYVVTLCVVGDPSACDFANAVEVTSGATARAAGVPGSFAVDLDVAAAFGTTDCSAPGTSCAVSTFAVSLSEAADEVELPVTFAARTAAIAPVGSPDRTAGAAGAGSGVLPRTGSDPIPMVAGGLMALLLGAGLVLGSRRVADA